LFDGRRFRAPNVVDDYSAQCRGIAQSDDSRWAQWQTARAQADFARAPASRIPNICRLRPSGGWWQPRVEVTLVKGRAFLAVIGGYYVEDNTAAWPLIIGDFDGG